MAMTCDNQTNATASDAFAVHGMQKVRGSNPLSSTYEVFTFR